MTDAAEAAGVPRTTVYSWLEHDEQFSLAYRLAELEATELLERAALDRALGYWTEDEVEEPVRAADDAPIVDDAGRPTLTLIKRVRKQEYSAALLMFLLRARAPDKYRERVDVTRTDLPPVKVLDRELFEIT